MPRFCRHNRLTAECPICSKGTVLDPARQAERRPRSRATTRRGAAAPAPVRGPYAAAGPYADGTEVRLERVPGGLRLAGWRAAQIAREAPELDVADMAGLLARAAEHGILDRVPSPAETVAADGICGVSRGRTGDFQDELRVERLDGDRVRVARWVLRPNAGWQLQEAPVMLPPARFAQALAAAAERGVLTPPAG